jgi:hypothetical protein
MSNLKKEKYQLKNKYFIRFREFLKLTGHAFNVKKSSIIIKNNPDIIFIFEADGVVVKRPLMPLRKITYSKLNYDRLLNLGISPV